MLNAPSPFMRRLVGISTDCGKDYFVSVEKSNHADYSNTVLIGSCGVDVCIHNSLYTYEIYVNHIGSDQGYKAESPGLSHFNIKLDYVSLWSSQTGPKKCFVPQN